MFKCQAGCRLQLHSRTVIGMQDIDKPFCLWPVSIISSWLRCTWPGLALSIAKRSQTWSSVPSLTTIFGARHASCWDESSQAPCLMGLLVGAGSLEARRPGHVGDGHLTRGSGVQLSPSTFEPLLALLTTTPYFLRSTECKVHRTSHIHCDCTPYLYTCPPGPVPANYVQVEM